MEFVRLQKEQNILTKPLYEEVFSEDKGAFSDYYYKYAAPKSTIYAAYTKAEEGGHWNNACPEHEAVPEASCRGLDASRIQSMVHLNPVTVIWNGERIQVPYIVAVATRKELRHQGLMRTLLDMIFRDLEAAKVPFAFLMPVNEAIYRPFGFRRTWSWQWEEDVTGDFPTGPVRQGTAPAGMEAVPAEQCTDETLQQLATYVNGKLAGKYELFSERSVAYYRRLEKEQQASGGQLQIRMKDGRAVAAVQTARDAYPPMMCRIMSREAYESRLKSPSDRPFENAFICEVV